MNAGAVIRMHYDLLRDRPFEEEKTEIAEED